MGGREGGGHDAGTLPAGIAGHPSAFPLAGAVLSGAPASASDSAAGGGTYVALGDSYASGAGVPDQSAGLCLRSSKNYGSLVAAAIAPSAYKDATCAAAKVAALTTPQTDLGIPVNGPQLEAITPDTTPVTLTIGGNDLGTSDFGIADIVAVCSTLSLTNPFGSPCILGANGAGKTTTLLGIHGRVPRTTGTIRLDGEDVTAYDTRRLVAAGIALCPENRHLFPSMSIEDNRLLGAHGTGRRTQQTRLERTY